VTGFDEKLGLVGKDPGRKRRGKVKVVPKLENFCILKDSSGVVHSSKFFILLKLENLTKHFPFLQSLGFQLFISISSIWFQLLIYL
jgi:hypothetical protein